MKFQNLLKLAAVLTFLPACSESPLATSSLAADQDRIDSLYGDRRLDEMSFLTSHNAFVNNSDGKWAAPNQGTMSLHKQLEFGAGAIMLDVHSYGGKATLCHEKCSGIPFLFPRGDFVKALNTVADHLNHDREKIVTIFLEDYSSHDEMRDALDKSEIRELMFDPYKEDVRGRGWPKLRDMINANKRVLILSDHGGKNDLGVGAERDFTVSNYWSIGTTGRDRECRSRWDDIPLDKKEERFERLFVMNHFRNIATWPTAEIDNRYSDIWERMERECVSVAGKKPNFIALDYINTGDGPRKVVDQLNNARGIAFQDSEFRGPAQMLLRGIIREDNLIFGNDQISSIRLFPGAKVRLFRDPDSQGFIGEISESMSYVGDDANDQISSMEID